MRLITSTAALRFRRSLVSSTLMSCSSASNTSAAKQTFPALGFKRQRYRRPGSIHPPHVVRHPATDSASYPTPVS